MKERQFTICSLLACCLLLVFSAISGLATPDVAGAADYPTKPIRLIVPYEPGGATDILARVVAAKLTDRLGQRVIVDNRPGAGGNIGAGIVAKEKPDGYTILVGNSTLCIAPSLYKLPFDMSRDFAPIIKMVDKASILSLNPSVPANSVKELIAFGKAHPGKLTYGSSGVGTPAHLAGELFSSMAGISMLHVPYKGGNQSMIDLISGQLQLIFATAATAIPNIGNGKIKGLAVCGLKRSAMVPNIPTIDESGLPGFDTGDWYGLLAPANTPRPIINRLNAEVTKVLAIPDVKEILFKNGLDIAPGMPEEFDSYIKSEMTKWAKVIKDSGVKPNF